jgi:hypothetical protein
MSSIPDGVLDCAADVAAEDANLGAIAGELASTGGKATLALRADADADAARRVA